MAILTGVTKIFSTTYYSESHHTDVTGDDKVFGSTEGDTVETGEGADTVDGGAGNDAFDLGGNDGDRDEVVLENGDGHDTITGVEGPVDLGGGEYSAQDQLNVSHLFDNDDNMDR